MSAPDKGSRPLGQSNIGLFIAALFFGSVAHSQDASQWFDGVKISEMFDQEMYYSIFVLDSQQSYITLLQLACITENNQSSLQVGVGLDLGEGGLSLSKTTTLNMRVDKEEVTESVLTFHGSPVGYTELARNGKFATKSHRKFLSDMVYGDVIFLYLVQAEQAASEKISLLGFTSASYTSLRKCGFNNPKAILEEPVW